MTKNHFFKELLEIDRSFSTHGRNFRALVIEIYKIYHEIQQLSRMKYSQ